MTRDAGSPIRWSSDFLEVDAERPALEALGAIRETTARWIVLRRRDGARYVLAVEEVLEHPKLHGYRGRLAELGRVSLAELLELREEQESTPTPHREPLPPLRWHPGERESCPSEGRYVLTYAAGVTQGVGVEEPDARRVRGHPITVPGGPEPPAGPPGDEGRSPVRHPSIEAEGPLLPGRPVTVSVDLRLGPAEETQGGEIDFGEQPADWRTLRVGFQLLSSGIHFDTSAGEVTVRRNEASIRGRCTGRVREELPEGARVDVTAVFQHEGRFCGTALRSFAVGREAGEPRAATRGGVLVEVGAEAPDLTVHVMVPDASAADALHWLVQPRELFDGLPPGLEGTIRVGRDTETFVTRLFGQYAQLERGRHRRSIEGFGEKLWATAPSCFRETYWAMWDRLRRPFTIQFISSEPNIPWELMRPSRPGELHPPLAVLHPVARWISSYRGYLRNRLPAGHLYTISPRYRSVAHRLTNAESEASVLEERLDARRVTATYDAVLSLLESAPAEPVAVLHFAGHGRFEAGSVDSSTISLEDGSLAVSEVAREAVRLGEACRTLVFFNACEVGAAGSALGAMGGWADALLGRHFGGFIAPLWAVDDEDATTVCYELLDGIITRHEPVGSVLRGIRERYGDVSPTFLSYVYYGDVNARVEPSRA